MRASTVEQFRLAQQEYTKLTYERMKPVHNYAISVPLPKVTSDGEGS